MDEKKPIIIRIQACEDEPSRGKLYRDVFVSVALLVASVFLFARALCAEELNPGAVYESLRGDIVQPEGPDVGTCRREGWSFNTSCCCTTGWCHAIPCAAVRHNGASYVLTLRPGEHPRVSAPTQWVVPEMNVDLSPDERCYACVGASQLRCLLVGSQGS